MICRIYDVRGGTLDQYDQVNEQLGPDTPDGARVHIAGKTSDGFQVIGGSASGDLHGNGGLQP